MHVRSPELNRAEKYMPKERPDAVMHGKDTPIEKKPTANKCEEGLPRRNRPPASAAYKILNLEGAISDRVLAHKMRPGWKEIRPFLCDYECAVRNKDADQHVNVPHDEMPKWWDAYNESKHRLPDGYEAGSMENTYLALAGLYVLHIMAREYSGEEYTFTKKERWSTSIRIAYPSTKIPYPKPIIVKPSSEIFVPKIMFLGSG